MSAHVFIEYVKRFEGKKKMRGYSAVCECGISLSYLLSLLSILSLFPNKY